MSKLMFRVYTRDRCSVNKADHRWKLMAAFVYIHHAERYISDCLEDCITSEYKIMQANRNVKVYNL